MQLNIQNSKFKIKHYDGEGPLQTLQYRQQLTRHIATVHHCHRNRHRQKAKENLLPMQPGDVPITYADVDELTQDTGLRRDDEKNDAIKRREVSRTGARNMVRLLLY